MRRFVGTTLWILPIVAVLGAIPPAKAARVDRGLSVMVLGSGGPSAHRTGRASSGYLVFVDRKPRILLDAGGGTYQRLAASGADIKDLELILLSHMHIDHTSDLPAIVKTVYFHNRAARKLRKAPIQIAGPAANGKPFPPAFSRANAAQYPATSEYADAHFDINKGIERYLHVFAPAISGGEFSYVSKDVAPDVMLPMQTIYDKDGLVVKSIGVVHGPVPALAYRIEYKGKALVYSGDTSSKTDNMISIARNADLLIYDTAITDTLPSGPKDKVFYALHTTPTRMGQVAAKAGARVLLLSHITAVTGPRMSQIKRRVAAQGFGGRIEVARDLAIFNLH